MKPVNTITVTQLTQINKVLCSTWQVTITSALAVYQVRVTLTCCCLHWVCQVPSWKRPHIICLRPEVDVRRRWECMVRYGATPRNPGIPTHAQTTKVGGVASPRDAVCNRNMTQQKRMGTFPYEMHNTYYTCIYLILY